MFKIRNLKQAVVDEEYEYKLVPRRRTDRRKVERRSSIPRKQGTAIRKIRGLDDIRFTPIRLGERRKGERRQSRPKLLSADEIVILRKK